MINQSALDAIEQHLEFCTDRERRSFLNWPSAMKFADNYVSGEIAVKNDDLLGFLLEILPHVKNKRFQLDDFWPARTRQNAVVKHYERSHYFFSLWLDATLTYTCAYFEPDTKSLEQAQLNKLQRTASDLTLSSGMNVCELGSGWGANAHYLQTEHNVIVDSYNISLEQSMFASDNFPDKRSYIYGSWQDVTRSDYFDRVVSIGMLEHVGKRDIPRLFKKVDEILKPNGQALFHFIGKSHPQPTSEVIKKYAFEGGYLPSLGFVSDCAGKAGLRVERVENWREHYVKTLQHWIDSFVVNKAQIISVSGFDEAEHRQWLLYLTGSLACFMLNLIQLYRVRFVKG